MTQLGSYLTVRDAPAAILFYERAFGAQHKYSLTGPGGVILHCEMELAGCGFMFSEESPDFGTQGPLTLGGTPVRLALTVDDADAVFKRAIEAGATSIIDIDTQFYGHRAGRLQDPFGHVWVISQVVEELSPEEMQRRADALFGG